jgi:hypothetical protein
MRRRASPRALLASAALALALALCAPVAASAAVPETSPPAAPVSTGTAAPLAAETTPAPSGSPEPSPRREASPSPSPSAPDDAPAPAPAPVPAPAPAPGNGSTAAPISITAPTSNTFVSGNVVAISGTKRTGSAVTVPGVIDGTPLCTVPADSGTTWACPRIALPSGTIGLTARELVDSVQTSESNGLTLRVLGAPAFTSAGPFINAGSLDGLGWDGANIRVVISAPISATQTCAQKVGDGYWYCGLDPSRFGDGTYRVQVQQSWPGSTTEWSPLSGTSTLVIDRGVPAAPVVTSPSPGTIAGGDTDAGGNSSANVSGAVPFSGTGETGATVDVYVDTTSVCRIEVVDRKWGCAVTGIPAGRHTVKALQSDAAGNTSAQSEPATITFAGSPSSPTAPPTSGTPAPASPGPDAVAPPGPGGTTAPSPGTPSDGQTLTPPAPGDGSGTPPQDPTPANPLLPPPPGGDSHLPPDQTWGTPTDYGAAILSPTQTVERGSWLGGVLLAVGWLLLIALPLRLLATTLRGRLALRGAHVTGRNRLSTELRLREERLQLDMGNPIFVAGGMLLGAALLAVLASGIQNEVRYVRLSLAVAAGLAVLNLASGLAMRVAGRLNDAGSHIRLVPLFLLVGAATAIISRVGGIQPPLIVGILIGFRFAMGVPARARGILQLAQISVMTVLAVAAWVLLGMVGPVEGFWPSALSEMLSVICLAGLGSALLLLLPVLSLPGRSIFEWSPPLWAATTLVVGLLAAIIVSGEEAPTVPIAIGATAVAAVSLAIWAWVRFVQPTPAR